MSYVCKKCGKIFEKQRALMGHCVTHSIKVQVKKIKTQEKNKIKSNKKHICKYCNLEFETGPSLGTHTRNCISNPKREDMIKRGHINRSISTNNDEYRAKLSAAVTAGIMKRVKAGTWHTSFKKTRTYDYKGERLHGKWELEYAKWLDNNNIKWKRPKDRFHYIFEEKDHYYTPDFYLVDTNEYVEIKGYETDKDRAKWKYFKLKLIILKGKDLRAMGINVW